MPDLVPGIHAFRFRGNEDVDGRDKPGHDEEKNRVRSVQCPKPF